jgi:hypothetical protein
MRQVRPICVFEPGLGAGDLSPRPLFRHLGEDDVMNRMGADFEGRTELTNLRGGHGASLGSHRHVKGAPQPVLDQELGDT